ncbi:hypothetical protein DAPPUDRAFT_234041 [Daphnia pulex]|uniref:Uncharacterized protein n=1 Tax=Daphnia pulex TaxID=6669 RepID=E9FUE8_DAPPU|nr:hypothetical protein DAPPUDRAFT_234041 [Daphnia pulex]|eukprot:EFX88715.1 hypothetical protein DAPPUDRAFT_234041 [Daphnia pulex]
MSDEIKPKRQDGLKAIEYEFPFLVSLGSLSLRLPIAPDNRAADVDRVVQFLRGKEQTSSS